MKWLIMNVCKIGAGTLAFLLSISIVFGQTGKIQGVIEDAETGQPLPGVNVYLIDTELGAATDAEGRYFILNIPAGTHDITASMIGYARLTKTDVLVEIDRISNVNFSLTTSAIEGEEVTVVAEQDILHKEVSSSQQIITAGQLTEAPSVTSVEEYLAKQVGVTDPERLNVRGGSPDQTMSIVNGIPYLDSRLGKAEASIPLSAVEQISVVSGGFNAEYGNFRSGLINITTKTGDKNAYHGSIDLRSHRGIQKRFGPSLYDTQNHFLRPILDPDVAFVGTGEAWADDPYTRQQYDSFVGWNTMANTFNSGKPAEEQATPLDLYMWTAWMFMVDVDFDKLESLGYDFSDYQSDVKDVVKNHAHAPEGSEPDWNIDAGFGGPVPFVSEALGDATFYISNNSKRRYYVQPVIRPYESQNVTLLTVNSQLSSDLKLTLDGLYREVAGVTSFVRGNHMSLSSAGLMSINNASIGVGRYLWYPTYFHRKNIYQAMLGFSLNKMISQRTFWDLSINTVRRADRVRTKYDRDDTILVRFGPIPLDERPYGRSGGRTTLDGFLFDEYERPPGIQYRFANKSGETFDDSKTNEYRIKFDLSSQVNNANLVKTGFSFNYTELNNVLWGIRIGHPEDAGENSFHRSPSHFGAYIQDQISYEAIVANLGIRADYYHAGGSWPSGDPFSKQAFAGGADVLEGEDPFVAYKSGRELAWEYWERVNSQNPGILEPIDDHFAVSPRIGVSFPVTEQSKFYFNYGHFRSLAPYISLFSHNSNPAGGVIDVLGNPNLEPPRTISYELGVDYNLLNQFLIRLGTYYKDVTGQHGEVEYENMDGTVTYDSYLNNEYEDIQGFELVVTKSAGSWITGWLNYNYMMKKQGLTGRDTFYEDPSKAAFFGLYEGQENRFIPQPRLTANVMITTPLNWGPSVIGHNILGGLRLSVLPTWQAGEAFTWNPLGKFHLSDNLRWPDYHVWDIKLSKIVDAGPVDIEAYCDIRNLFNNKWTPLEMAFSGSSDSRNYFSSLHLPVYDSPEFDELRNANPGLYIPGDDKPGMLRSEERPYINDPNYDLFLHGNRLPRDIWFGVRLRF